MLGLDESFSREIVYGVVCLASDIVERMALGAAAAPGAPLSLESKLDGYDEATRLEDHAQGCTQCLIGGPQPLAHRHTAHPQPHVRA